MFDSIIHQSFILIVLISGVPLVAASAFGLLIAIVQGATSVQEQSITYLVKLIAVSAVLATCGSWFFSELSAFIQESFQSMLYIGRGR